MLDSTETSAELPQDQSALEFLVDGAATQRLYQQLDKVVIRHFDRIHGVCSSVYFENATPE